MSEYKKKSDNKIRFKPDGTPYIPREYHMSDEAREKMSNLMREKRAEWAKRDDIQYFKPKGDARSDAARMKSRLNCMTNEKKRKNMQKALSDLLSLEMGNGNLIDTEDVQKFFQLAGQNTNVQTALLIAQINNAMAGDVKAFKVLTEVLGETAQKVEVDLKADNKNKLDSILTQTTSHTTYDEEDLKAMEEMDDELDTEEDEEE